MIRVLLGMFLLCSIRQWWLKDTDTVSYRRTRGASRRSAAGRLKSYFAQHNNWSFRGSEKDQCFDAHIMASTKENEEPDLDVKKFYSNAKNHWDEVEPTVDGMLGGFSYVSHTDVEGSTKFLNAVKAKLKVGGSRALDCGAGIGRVTKHFLLKHFETVELVEQSSHFLERAPEYLGPTLTPRVPRLICSGLQEFTPDEGQYDVIWCQWVLSHLTNEDLIAFLQRCVTGLRPHGVIVVKENISSAEEMDFDEDDSSYTRNSECFRHVFKSAGLTVVKEMKQKKFPDELYEVRMFALRVQ